MCIQWLNVFTFGIFVSLYQQCLLVTLYPGGMLEIQEQNMVSVMRAFTRWYQVKSNGYIA
jgi:hypothetical protein